MYRIVEVCYFEIYAECVKLVIHTYDGLGETVSKDCEPLRPQHLFRLAHLISLSLDDVFRTTGLSDRFALPTPGNRTCCSDRTPDDQVRTQAAQKLYL